MSVWSQESIVKFINLYKKHPCLWKVKCPDYKNRQKRARAYGELVAFCKRIGFKNANRDFASKKIQCLRSAFRKELRKILASLEHSKSEEDAYKPSLFYFDLLMFTQDQEIGDDDDDEANDDDNDNDQDDEIDDDNNEDSNDGSWKADVKDIAKIDVSPHPETSANTSNAFSIDGRFCQRDEIVASSSSNPRSIRGLKRKHSPGRTSVNSNISESEAFGVIVSKKLQKMSHLQSVYAETIILNVLRKGLLNHLTADTDLCDNHCSKNFIG